MVPILPSLLTLPRQIWGDGGGGRAEAAVAALGGDVAALMGRGKKMVVMTIKQKVIWERRGEERRQRQGLRG